jgi:hypothetical protein
MTSENEFEQGPDSGAGHESTRRLLRMSTTKAAPADLEQKVMLSVMAVGSRRRDRRVALARTLKIVAIGMLVLAMGKVVAPHAGVSQAGAKDVVDQIGHGARDYGQLLDWLQRHSYLFIAPFVLWLFYRGLVRFWGRRASV